MVIERDDAARALAEAQRAAGRTADVINYRYASPYLLLWGLVWLVGNLVSQFLPAWSGPVWMGGVALGVAGSVLIGVRIGGRDGRRGGGAASLMISLAFAAFGIGVSVVAPFQSWAQSEAFFCLAVGAAYIVMGAFIGWRIAAVGVVVMAVTLGGWLYARDQFFLWMALAGGGGLLLGGFWLRKV